jgi:hypothetical protein
MMGGYGGVDEIASEPSEAGEGAIFVCAGKP